MRAHASTRGHEKSAGHRTMGAFMRLRIPAAKPGRVIERGSVMVRQVGRARKCRLRGATWKPHACPASHAEPPFRRLVAGRCPAFEDVGAVFAPQFREDDRREGIRRKRIPALGMISVFQQVKLVGLPISIGARDSTATSTCALAHGARSRFKARKQANKTRLCSAST